jgi:hypothetical protein
VRPAAIAAAFAAWSGTVQFQGLPATLRLFVFAKVVDIGNSVKISAAASKIAVSVFLMCFISFSP